MKLNAGEDIYFKSTSDTVKHKATIVASDASSIILQADNANNVKNGQFLVITTEEGYHYTEVMEVRDRTIVLKPMFSERRQYFRVDDVFPVASKKVDSESAFRGAKMLLEHQYDAELPDADLQDKTINPALWNMLVNINRKLGMIMEHLHLQSEGLVKIEPAKVNISASGMRFVVNERLEKDDVVEVKMLLPTHPPTAIVAYSNVVRVDATKDDKYDIALIFSHMNDDVREEIIRYTINRQREIIKKHKSETGNDI
jgi:hypothetical protein